MERFTEKNGLGQWTVFRQGCTGMDMARGPAIDRLAEYEDADEAGLLIRIPVPLHTTVFALGWSKVQKEYCIVPTPFCMDYLDKWNEDYFATREAAQQEIDRRYGLGKEGSTMRFCPRCGGLDVALWMRSVPNKKVTYLVRCDDCDIETRPFDTKEDAVLAWNRGEIFPLEEE